VAHPSLELIFSTSRRGAEDFSWLAPFAVISITDPHSPPAMLSDTNMHAVLRLEFWDLTTTHGEQPVFDEELAQRILDFVDFECNGARLLAVHCEAGISRSTAVAIALGNVLDLPVRHENGEFVSPNALVLDCFQRLNEATPHA